MPPHPPVTREKAVATLAQLCREGYANQIVIGNDACSWQMMVRFETEESSPDLYTNSYLIFPQQIVPMLLEAGVTQDQIDTMTLETPRRLFEVNAH
jgi:phosphotriesterase-related protein